MDILTAALAVVVVALATFIVTVRTTPRTTREPSARHDRDPDRQAYLDRLYSDELHPLTGQLTQAQDATVRLNRTLTATSDRLAAVEAERLSERALALTRAQELADERDAATAALAQLRTALEDRASELAAHLTTEHAMARLDEVRYALDRMPAAVTDEWEAAR